MHLEVCNADREILEEYNKNSSTTSVYVSGRVISLFASKDQSGFNWNATFYHSSFLWHTAKQCLVRNFPLRMPQALSVTLVKGASTSSLLIFSFSFHL